MKYTFPTHSLARIDQMILLVIMFLCTLSCEKEELSPTEVSNVDRLEEIPYGPGVTRLGRKLLNPYNVDNMRRAAELIAPLYPADKSAISTTHVYLKLFPGSGEDFVDLMDFAEVNDLVFEVQPHDFEVLYNGEDGYVDPTVPEGTIPPVYGSVPVSLLTSSVLSTISHEVLEELHLNPEGYATRLTFTAFVISGNEIDYEAVDGYCHPDCPNWPVCLDAPEFACTPNVPIKDINTLKPVDYGETPAKFPDYILDDAMGKDGQIKSITECEAIVNNRPTSCNPGFSPVLRPDPNEPGSCRWDCVNPNPTPAVNNSCNCLSTSYYKRPGGKIILEDTELGDEGVRRVKVRTTKYRWGFLWKTTDTDDEGCWNMNSNYDVKRAKVQVVFKDRVSSRAVIRSFRGARFWNAFLEAVDFTWYLTRDGHRWNNLCLRIEDSNDNTSLDEQTFVAATTNNAVHEFYDDHSSFLSPGRTHILIHTLGSSLNSAPMFRMMDDQMLSTADITNHLNAFSNPFSNPFTGALYLYWQVSKPDVFISFGDDDPSDQKKETVYHEMAHVVQFGRLGNQWWRDYVQYIGRVAVRNAVSDGEDHLYGDGSMSGSGLPELAEGLAYPIGQFMTGQQYGSNHSLSTFRTSNAWARRAESKNFHLADTDFIPRGLFYDLFDSPDFPASVSSASETIPGGEDSVEGISFEEQYRALNFLVTDIDQFKTRLIQINSTNNGIADIENIFSAYGH